MGELHFDGLEPDVGAVVLGWMQTHCPCLDKRTALNVVRGQSGALLDASFGVYRRKSLDALAHERKPLDSDSLFDAFREDLYLDVGAILFEQYLASARSTADTSFEMTLHAAIEYLSDHYERFLRVTSADVVKSAETRADAGAPRRLHLS